MGDNELCKIDKICSKMCIRDSETGDVTATFTSNVTNFKKASEVIATAYDGDVNIESEGVVTFVEDESKTTKTLKDITISGLVNGVIDKDTVIKLKLSGDYEFTNTVGTGSLLNDTATVNVTRIDEDEIKVTFSGDSLEDNQKAILTLSGIELKTTKSCSAGDKATITVSSKDFSSVKLEVARMVEEAVTYTVEDLSLIHI